jgi:TetR/AcrR family transcriptional regulator
MARPRAPDFDDQRSAILARAADLFARHGYHATTMNDLASGSGISKGALYHYFSEKSELLFGIADGHVSRLQDLVARVQADASLDPEGRLQTLITRFLEIYTDAQNFHRVLTEDVKFLADDKRKSVLDKQRFVVAGFADAISAVRPEMRAARLDKVLTMLLFGMLNWMFMWVRRDGALSHADMAPLVNELFLRGLTGLSTTTTVANRSRARRRTRNAAKSLAGAARS